MSRTRSIRESSSPTGAPRETSKEARPSPPAGPRPPAAILQILFEDLAVLNESAQRWFERLVDWVFDFTQSGGRRRWYAFLLLTLLVWFAIALFTYPLGQSQAPLMSQLFTALFSKEVLRHFLILALALWLALRLAVIYLDDIFELRDVEVADQFLRQAAFASRYPALIIRDGRLAPEQLESPVVSIGGPGRVNVHLENAALFETTDGQPHLIRPTLKKSVVLDGFERLRRVIDLRDQVLETSVSGRTQDGIPVTAVDVRVVFHVYRGEGHGARNPELHQPYPFDQQAVYALTYRQGPGPWTDAMRSMIQAELRNFISRHTLDEFLAYTTGVLKPDRFVGREEITDLFYDFKRGFAERARENGIQLAWIGVGTWATPSEIIPERHVEAWRLSSDNRIRVSEANLGKLRSESRVAELVRLVDFIPATYYEITGQDLAPEQAMRRMLLVYREKLNHARRIYEEQNKPVPPEMEAVIRHLNSLLAIRLGSRV